MRSLLLPLLILCCVFAATPAHGVDAGKPEAPRIAVLRLEDTLTAFKLYTGGMEKLKQDVAEGQKAIKALEDRLAELDTKLQVMPETSPGYPAVKEEFEVTRLKEKMLVERGNADIDRRRAALVKEAFTNLRGHLQAFCQERGILLVHLAPNPELSATNNKDLNAQLFSESVLYFDAKLDITDAFIPYLNDRWSTESVKDAPKDLPKDLPKDAPKDLPKDASKDPAVVPAPAPQPAPAPAPPGK